MFVCAYVPHEIMSNTPEKKQQRRGMATLLKSHGHHLIHS
jgi:hypothetical protein